MCAVVESGRQSALANVSGWWECDSYVPGLPH